MHYWQGDHWPMTQLHYCPGTVHMHLVLEAVVDRHWPAVVYCQKYTLCKTAVAVMIVQQLLGWSCRAPPESSRHRYLVFHRPNNIVFLVFVSAFWYLAWDAVETLSGRKGDIRCGWMPQPLSPKSHPFLPPPLSTCTCKHLVKGSRIVYRTKPFGNYICKRQLCIAYCHHIAWKPLWQT